MELQYLFFASGTFSHSKPAWLDPEELRLVWDLQPSPASLPAVPLSAT